MKISTAAVEIWIDSENPIAWVSDADYALLYLRPEEREGPPGGEQPRLRLNSRRTLVLNGVCLGDVPQGKRPRNESPAGVT
jgi:hypothetical protein